MSSDYLPILIQILIAVGFAGVTLLISVVLGKSAPRSEIKDSAYECGMLPIGETQPRFSVKFYLVAMLFVIFDIEVVFMYPWAVTFQELVVRDGVTIAFWSALSFVGILFVAYLYALKKGALRWSD